MSLKRLPTPNADAGNWGTILNEYINQLSPTPKGGINTWTTGTRPSSLTVDDEGRTGINTDTNVIERWSGTSWVTVLSASSSLPAANTTTDGYLTSVDWNTFNNKQANITPGTNSQFLRGDKSWQDFATTARSVVLTGLSTATQTAVSAADSVLAAFGKVQAQLTYILALRGYIHIKDFGAKADGTTDDSAAVQAAIDYGRSNFLGVDFGSGTIRATGLIIYSYSRLFSSAGFGNCTVKAPNNSNNDILTTSGFTTATASGDRTRAAIKFSIQDIIFDGNSANNSPTTLFNHTESAQGNNQAAAKGFGLKLYGLAYRLINVSVYNCPSVGIYSECGVNPGANLYGTYNDTESLLLNVHAEDSGVVDIIWRGPNDSQWNNVFAAGVNANSISHVVVEDSANYGAFGLQVSNVHTYGNTTGPGVHVRGTYSKLLGSALVFEGTTTVNKPAFRLETGGNVLSGLQSYAGQIGGEILANENNIEGEFIGFAADSIRLGNVSIQAKHNLIRMGSRFSNNGINYVNADFNDVKGYIRGDVGSFTSGTKGTNGAEDLYKTGSLGIARQITWPNLPTANTGLGSSEVWSDSGTLKLGSASAGTNIGSASGVLPIANGGTGSSTKNFVDLTTNQTITGFKTINNDLSVNGTNFILDNAGNKSFRMRTSGLDRWVVGTTNSETGSNVGGDFSIFAFNDAGTFLSTPFQIKRSTGELQAFTVATSININTPNVATKAINFRVNTVPRWAINVNGVTESGGNVGSDFSLSRFDDAGTFVDNPLNINRSTGVTTFGGSVTFADAKNMSFGTATGTQIGTGTSQKLAFYGGTPVTRPAKSGTGTAGPSYTGNEQAMLQSMWDALNNLNLMG